MKTITSIIVALAMVALFSVTAMAVDPPPGLVGLEITGNSGVGAVGYLGEAQSVSTNTSCFTNSTTNSTQGFIGAGITSNAAGNVCMSASGPTPGTVNGNGHFNSSVSGELGVPGSGVRFNTSSNVNVYGNN